MPSVGEVFEIHERGERLQGRPIVGGGRYDALLRLLGAGCDVPAVGASVRLDPLVPAVGASPVRAPPGAGGVDVISHVKSYKSR